MCYVSNIQKMTIFSRYTEEKVAIFSGLKVSAHAPMQDTEYRVCTGTERTGGQDTNGPIAGFFQLILLKAHLLVLEIILHKANFIDQTS